MRQGLKKLRSTAKRGKTLARAAKAAAGSRAHLTQDGRERAQRALLAIMADARGVPMKVGQFLASLPEGESFDPLLDGIEPRPLSEMLAVVEASLGRPHHEVFESIETSRAAASLGQVHRARLVDGTPVAVKIRYPDIVEAVEAELRLAMLFPNVGPVKKWEFDLDAYKCTLLEGLERELNYRREAAVQALFADALTVEGLSVPRVYWELCGPAVLVQDWAEGANLREAATWPVEVRERLGRVLVGTLLQSLFVLGAVHCDPHRGNYFFRRNEVGPPEVTLLDFGSTIEVETEAGLALLRLILAGRGEAIERLPCLIDLGFNPDKLARLGPKLDIACDLALMPFSTGRPLRPGEWRLVQRLEDALLEDLWLVRSATPPSLLFLLRAFQGLVLQLDTLRVAVDWWEVLCEVVDEALLVRARLKTDTLV